MEFNEKLQKLRAERNMTQEELAEKLFVSRTAISKWESGKGYPNIESLKWLSKYFSVSIDELLSGEELIHLAQDENRANVGKIYSILFSILDLMVIMLILLPFYANPIEGHFYAVNLFSYTNTSNLNLLIYWIFYVILISLGIIKLFLSKFEQKLWENRILKISIGLNALAVCLFAAVREPYVTAILFIFFSLKMLLWFKQVKMK